MKAVILVVVLAFSTLAEASPWSDNCVNIWGGDIPKESRTQDNCPSGSNHYDRKATMDALVAQRTEILAQAQAQGLADRIAYTGVNSYASQTLPQSINTNVGNYVIGRSSATGNVNAIIGPNFRR